MKIDHFWPGLFVGQLRQNATATILSTISIPSVLLLILLRPKIDPTMSAAETSTKPSRFIAFFDECGDHSLEKIDLDFPLFVLALVVIERDVYRDQVLPELNRFKLRYWNHEGINLHSRDIRLATGPFSLLLNPAVRPTFITELSDILQRLPFTLFISAVRKQTHVERYGKDATNPYDLSLEFTMETLVHFLESHDEIQLPIVAEARGKREDNALEQAYYRLLARGTEHLPAERFKRLNCPLSFLSKKNNIAGIQLADLCAHPCARHILNPQKENRAFEVARKHLYGNDALTGWKIFP